jgi:hypothetical protein
LLVAVQQVTTWFMLTWRRQTVLTDGHVRYGVRVLTLCLTFHQADSGRVHKRFRLLRAWSWCVAIHISRPTFHLVDASRMYVNDVGWFGGFNELLTPGGGGTINFVRGSLLACRYGRRRAFTVTTPSVVHLSLAVIDVGWIRWTDMVWTWAAIGTWGCQAAVLGCDLDPGIETDIRRVAPLHRQSGAFRHGQNAQLLFSWSWGVHGTSLVRLYGTYPRRAV